MNGPGPVSFFRAACVFVLALSATGSDGLRAQALKIERHAFGRLTELRSALGEKWALAKPAQRELASAKAMERSSGQPFDDIARVLASIDGLEADASFRARTGLLCLALPGIIDPDVLGEVHVTMHAPRIIPDLGAARFELRIVDADGEVVREDVIERQTGVEDLLRFRASRAIDVGALPDGSYRVKVRTSFEGGGDSGSGLEDTASFSILRGYKRRADALPIVVGVDAERADSARRILESLAPGRQDPVSQAILTGAVWEVAGPYAGEPHPESLNPVWDLERAEAVLDNLRRDRPALSGLHGRMTVGFPLRAEDASSGAAVGTLSIDLPTTDVQGPLPLMVFVPATPAWDEDGTRPMSPRSLAAAYGAEQAWAAGLEDPAWFCAALESPGRYPSSARAVEDAVRFLLEVLPVGDQGVLLIGEREGAYAAARAAIALGDLCRGLVQVNGSGLSREDVASREGLQVLLVSAVGHPTRSVLGSLAGAERPTVSLVDLEDVAAVAALRVAGPRIRDFIQDTLDVRCASEEFRRPAADLTSGVVVAEVAGRSTDRAIGLLRWCRAQGRGNALLRVAGDDRLQVVIPVAESDAAEIVAELRAMGAPDFDPSLFEPAQAGAALPRIERFEPR
jgi:pimeloyl-ACP methyl ester carboxylesterase